MLSAYRGYVLLQRTDCSPSHTFPGKDHSHMLSFIVTSDNYDLYKLPIPLKGFFDFSHFIGSVLEHCLWKTIGFTTICFTFRLPNPCPLLQCSYGRHAVFSIFHWDVLRFSFLLLHNRTFRHVVTQDGWTCEMEFYFILLHLAAIEARVRRTCSVTFNPN